MSKKFLKTNPEEEIKKLKKTEKQTTINDVVLERFEKDVLLAFRVPESKRNTIRHLAGIENTTIEELMNRIIDNYIDSKQDILNFLK